MLPAVIHCYILASMQRESVEDIRENLVLFTYCFQDDTFATMATAPPLREGFCAITKPSLSITLLLLLSLPRHYEARRSTAQACGPAMIGANSTSELDASLPPFPAPWREVAMAKWDAE
jgi:hypothetical protein